MDIIDYLSYELHKAEFVSTLIMLFGAQEVLTAYQYNVITIEEHQDDEYSIAYLTIN
jgi:hypothetical protein